MSSASRRNSNQKTHPGFSSGRYYTSPGLSAPNIYAIGNNFIYVNYFQVSNRTTFDRICLRITTASTAGGLARLGIYAINNSGMPSDLIVDTGNLSIDTTGDKLATINQSLIPGWYALASLFSATCQVVGTTTSNVYLQNIGIIDPASIWQMGRTGVTFAYGALPNTFPSGIIVDTNPSPLIAIRAA